MSNFWHFSLKGLDETCVTARHTILSHNEDGERGLRVDVPVRYTFQHEGGIWSNDDPSKSYDPIINKKVDHVKFIHVVYWLEGTEGGKMLLHLVSNCGSYHGLLTSEVTIQPEPADFTLYAEQKAMVLKHEATSEIYVLHCRSVQLFAMAEDGWMCVEQAGEVDENEQFLEPIHVPVHHLTVLTKKEWKLQIVPCFCCNRYTDHKPIDSLIFIRQDITIGCSWVKYDKIYKAMFKACTVLQHGDVILPDLELPYVHVLLPILAAMSDPTDHNLNKLLDK